MQCSLPVQVLRYKQSKLARSGMCFKNFIISITVNTLKQFDTGAQMASIYYLKMHR